MVELLRPYPNYYLVGSETNYLIGHEGGAWRGGVVGSDLLGCEEEGRVFTGDAGLLRRAHAARDSHLILETRLDADDGLVAGYLEHVQRNAVELFGEGGHRRGGGGARAPGPAEVAILVLSPERGVVRRSRDRRGNHERRPALPALRDARDHHRLRRGDCVRGGAHV